MDTNNRQLHEDNKAKEKTLAKQLAEQSKGKYTQAQIEDALRAANNKKLGETVQTGMIVTLDENTSANAVHDNTGMFLSNDGMGKSLLVQNPAMLQTPSEELRNFVLAYTG